MQATVRWCSFSGLGTFTRTTYFAPVNFCRFCCSLPSQVYADRVKNGEITNDPHQVKVMQSMDRLYKEISNYKPIPRRPDTFMSKIFGKVGQSNCTHIFDKCVIRHVKIFTWI